MPFLSKFASEYISRWVQAKWEELKLNFIQQLLVHADNVHLLMKVYVLCRKTQKLQQSLVRRLVKKQVLKERNVYMSCGQNAGQNYNVKISNKYFENVLKFRHWGATIKNKNYISEQRPK